MRPSIRTESFLARWVIEIPAGCATGSAGSELNGSALFRNAIVESVDGVPASAVSSGQFEVKVDGVVADTFPASVSISGPIGERELEAEVHDRHIGHQSRLELVFHAKAGTPFEIASKLHVQLLFSQSFHDGD